jgi:hypothetical protein
MVNEHYLQHLLELSFIVYDFSRRLSFVCGLPAPIRPAAWSRGMEAGLVTYFTRSTHLADEGSTVFRAAGSRSSE